MAAGNTVVLKPAEQTPLSATLLFEVFDAAGFPPGVVNLVCGDPEEIGEVLTSAPEVRQLSFTGSLAVGRMLATRCAAAGKHATLELGGHAPFVVFADADLDLAAEKLTFSKLQNAGQTCIAANRVLVERPALDGLAERLRRAGARRAGRRRAGAGRHGRPADRPPGRGQGRATTCRTPLDRGARALAGGGPVDGLDPERFFAPTVLADVPLDARVATEETFGPVAPLIPFDTEEEAIAVANASEYGLAAYLFTRDLGRAHRVGEALDYGMVAINDGVAGLGAGAVRRDQGLGRRARGRPAGARGLPRRAVPERQLLRLGHFVSVRLTKCPSLGDAASGPSAAAAVAASSPIGRSSRLGSSPRSSSRAGRSARRHLGRPHAQRALGRDPLERQDRAQVVHRAPRLRRGLPGEARVLLEPARDRRRAEHRRHGLRPQPAERVGGEVLGDEHPGGARLVDRQERRQPGQARRHEVREPGGGEAGEGDDREPHGVQRQRARRGVEAAVVERLPVREEAGSPRRR